MFDNEGLSCPAFQPCLVQARQDVVNTALRADVGGMCPIETQMGVNPFFIDVVQPEAMPEAMVGISAPAKTLGRARIPRIRWTMARMLRKSFRNLNGTGGGQARR